MSRKKAREVAMKIAFAQLLGGESSYFDAMEQSGEQDKVSKTDIEFASTLVDGVCRHESEIDEAISDNLNNWTIDRIPKVELVIMRIAVYELMFVKENPVKAVVNEAVNLAKQYGSEDRSYAYVNGVLGSYIRYGMNSEEGNDDNPENDE